MATEEVKISELNPGEFSALKSTGNIVVSANSRTYKMPLNEIASAIPSKTSDITNDSSFVKSTGSAIVDIQVVDELPESPSATTLYLVKE